MPPGCRWMSRCWRSTCRRRRRSALALAYGTPARKVRRPTSCWPAISARSATISPRPRGCRWPGCISIWCGAPRELDAVLDAARPEQWLSLGLVDGRNIWRADLRAALGDCCRRVAARRGDAAADGRALVQPAARAGRSWRRRAGSIREVKGWLAFADAEAGRGGGAGPRPRRGRGGDQPRSWRRATRPCGPAGSSDAGASAGRRSRAWRP